MVKALRIIIVVIIIIIIIYYYCRLRAKFRGVSGRKKKKLLDANAGRRIPEYLGFLREYVRI